MTAPREDGMTNTQTTPTVEEARAVVLGRMLPGAARPENARGANGAIDALIAAVRADEAQKAEAALADLDEAIERSWLYDSFKCSICYATEFHTGEGKHDDGCVVPKVLARRAALLDPEVPATPATQEGPRGE